MEWRLTAATPPGQEASLGNTPLSTPGARRGRGELGRREEGRGRREEARGRSEGGRREDGRGKRQVSTSPETKGGMREVGRREGGGREGGTRSSKGGGKGRSKSLITTEFSPAEWNINNLNKYKK